MKVFVYWNLHKKLFSIKNLKTNKVELHLNEVYLTNVKFKVSQKGREKVLKTKQKNVHAGVVGIMSEPFNYDINQEITYNPYKNESFVFKQDKTPIFESNGVFMKDKKVYNNAN